VSGDEWERSGKREEEGPGMALGHKGKGRWKNEIENNIKSATLEVL
jgi:hypothetical protein